ncbi:MAG: ABC transporter substrate-binding protein, partial [Candidatus Binatia bacterium]
MYAWVKRESCKFTVVLALLVLFCGWMDDAWGQAQAQQKSEKPKRGGHLIFATSKTMTTPHPFIGSRSVSASIKQSMYQSLTAYDEKGDLQGVLASEWNSKQDNSVWVFNLRQGVKFHNGKEMSADDVVWSVKYIMDADNGAGGYGVLSRAVKEVKALGKYGLEFLLKSSDALFPQSIEGLEPITVIPANSLAPKTLKVGSEPPPGTGPFKFESWRAGQDLTVARFDDYWGGRPYLDRITFKLIAQEAGRFNALRAGDVHIAERLSPIRAQRVKKGAVTGIHINSAGVTGGRVLAFNFTSMQFKNPLLRQAFALSLDRDAIIDQATLGVGLPRVINVPPGSVFDKGLPQGTKRDVARARELLKKAGYDGSAIVVLGRRGHEEWLEPIQRQASEAGFNVKLLIVESNIYSEREQQGAFDAVLENVSGANEPGVSYVSEFGCIPEGGARGANVGLYCNRDFDRLGQEYLRESDVNKRAGCLRQMAKILLDDVALYTIGYANDRWFGWSDKVMGFRNNEQS